MPNIDPITNPDGFINAIEADIPDETIIGESTSPTTIPPVTISWGQILETGQPYQSSNSMRQHADVAMKEKAASRGLQRSVQTSIKQEAVSSHTEYGGDTRSTVRVRPSLNFQISIPVSIQVS